MLAAKQPVFNLTVAEAHCYYADGILVHNCDALAWAIRVSLLNAPPRREATEPKVKSWKDKLTGMMNKRGASHMAS